MGKQIRISKAKKEHGPFSSRLNAVKVARKELGPGKKVGADFWAYTHGGEWWYWSEIKPEEEPKKRSKKDVKVVKVRVGVLGLGADLPVLTWALEQFGLSVSKGATNGGEIHLLITSRPLSKAEVKRHAFGGTSARAGA